MCNSPVPTFPSDGQSHPNIEGKIVSGMEEGVDPASGLTELGREQARKAGKELKEVLLGAGCSPANTIVSWDWVVVGARLRARVCVSVCVLSFTMNT